MTKKVRLRVHFAILLMSFLSSSVYAVENINDLLEADKLRISLSVPSDKTYIAGQAFTLSIKVATQRWFAKGSKVKSFTLPNVVMQSNNIETLNGNERINNQTWATQTHEITLFPTQAGTYVVPAIEIAISVNTENSGIISGELYTKPNSFHITLPESLTNITQYIASPNATITLDSNVIDLTDNELENERTYTVGDAITQTITINAENIPAMMIPALASIIDKLPGLSIYHKPAQLLDKTNRGTVIGTRIESFTYIFEQAGQYTLPAQEIYWWNTETESLETLTVPASKLTVDSGSLAKRITGMHLSDMTLNTRSISVLVIILLITFSVIMLIKYRHVLFIFYKKHTNYQQRQVRQQFLINIINQDHLLAVESLYQYATLLNAVDIVKNLPLAKKLNQAAFDDKSTESLTITEAKRLLKQTSSTSTKPMNGKHFSSTGRIKIN